MRRYNQALTWMVSPVAAFGTVWIIQALAYSALPINLTPPSIETWLIVATGFLSLLFGALTFNEFNLRRVPSPNADATRVAGSTYIDLRLLYSSLAFSALAAFFLFATLERNEIGFLHRLKEVLLDESVSGDKVYTYVSYVFIYQLLLILYYFNVNGLRKDLRTLLFFVAAILAAILSGSRGPVVFFLVALIPCIATKEHEMHFSKRTIGILSSLGVASFFLYPFVFQAMSVGDAGGWSTFVNYISVYFFSGVAAFSDFVQTNTPHFDCLLLAPRPLIGAVDGLLRENWLASCPAIYEQKFVPLSTNVYSIFFAPYHDFGLVGVVLYLFAIGFISQMAFARGCLQHDDSWRFFYCILFYSLVLSFFEDQFARGAIYYFFGLAAFMSNKLIKRW